MQINSLNSPVTFASLPNEKKTFINSAPDAQADTLRIRFGAGQYSQKAYLAALRVLELQLKLQRLRKELEAEISQAKNKVGGDLDNVIFHYAKDNPMDPKVTVAHLCLVLSASPRLETQRKMLEALSARNISLRDLAEKYDVDTRKLNRELLQEIYPRA